jgi:hypothetical protein
VFAGKNRCREAVPKPIYNFTPIRNFGAFLTLSRQKPGFPLQVLEIAHAISPGFPLQSLAPHRLLFATLTAYP